MKQMLSGNDWIVSHFAPGEVEPYLPWISQISKGAQWGGSFIPATVPGDVQSDALDAGLIEDINQGYNARKAEWTYQRDWLYVKRFTVEDAPCERIRLCFDGVDYACNVFLNGKWLGGHEVAWIPFDFDITEHIQKDQENYLCVLVKAAPQAECQWGRTTKVDNMKARFAYQWDFCTRLVPLGIWKDVYLKYEQKLAFTDLHAVSDVDYLNKTATIHAKAKVAGDLTRYAVSFCLKHPDGSTQCVKVTAEGEEAEARFEVDNAQLWYPNGMGEQPLYQLTAVLEENWDTRTVRVGLRHIEWTRTEGASEEALCYQPYINGRRVYLQGFNFTPIRQLYGRTHRKAYWKRLMLSKRCGANYIRVWGGGLLEREEFYDLCDELGLLVMQELFQSSSGGNNHPSKEPEFLELLLKTVESAVIQKRNHPCLISWCGGNELTYRGEYIDDKGNILIEGAEGNEGFTYPVVGCKWLALSPEYPTLKAVEEKVRSLDPGRMWFHTSGSGPYTHAPNLALVGGKMHDIHGPWGWNHPITFYELYNALDMMIHHEFGVSGSASVQTLEHILPKEYLWPLDATNPMLQYHGRGWAGNFGTLCNFFGEINDYRTAALASRFIQWEHNRYALEAHRRLGAKCAGSCLWHMGEPWANAIECCTMDAYDQVKPAYYGEAAAFRPLHIAPRYEAVIHKDAIEIEMSLYNATEKPFSGRIRVQTFTLTGALLEEKECSCYADADSVVPKAAVCRFEKVYDGPVFLRQYLMDSSGKVVDSGYSIHGMQEMPYAALLTQPACQIHAVLEGNLLKLKNKGDCVVSGLTVECSNDRDVMFSDGCIMLLPGEQKEIALDFSGQTPGPLYISGFGVPYQKLCLNA